MYAASAAPQKCGVWHTQDTSKQAAYRLRPFHAPQAVGVCAYPFLDRPSGIPPGGTSAVTMHRCGG